MRLGVLDVGSNTVHMLVVDAHPGARPLPAFSRRFDLSLAAHLDRSGNLSRVGEARLTEVVEEALRIAEDKGVEDFLAFATSAVRDAGNSDEVLARIEEQHRRPHPGAVRRERGAADLPRRAALVRLVVGRLLVVDIGGGSLEIAAGPDEEPEAVMSLPLGAGRLTRDWFTADPPSAGRGARAAQARAGGDRPDGGRAAPRRRRRSRGRHVEDLQAARQDRRGRAVERGLLREAVPQAQRREPVGGAARRRWTAPNAPGFPGCPRDERRRCPPAPSSRTP